jgi:putative oxidoreductase
VNLIRIILHGLFGGAFVYAGSVKAWEPTAFLDDIRSFELIPDPYAGIVALFLPYLEIFAGLAVMLSLFRKGGLAVLVTCLILFLGAIMSAWFREIDIRCGCFGSQGDAASNYMELMARDLVLLAWGGWLLRLEFRHNPSAPPPP